MTRFFLLIIFLGIFNRVFPQLSGFNLMEYQYGGFPSDTTKFSGLYDRAKIDYLYGRFKGAITLEQYNTPFEARNYLKLTQYSLQFAADSLEIRIGNYYETIGRGILLRSFEIPGAILEDFGYRSRHYFHRDMQGFLVRYRLGNLRTKLMYGKPLNYVFPPTQAETNRRPDITEAINVDYKIKKNTLGASALRLTNSSGNKIYGLLSGEGKLGNGILYYVGIAKNISHFSLDNYSNNSPYAFYGSLSISKGGFGMSIEYKNYNNILLGAGINEPPALVKEHTYKTLNRSTHVLQPLNEHGYQVEAYKFFNDASVLTVNHTLARNKFDKTFVFTEYFIEYNRTFLEKTDLKLFFDYANDPFKSEHSRISSGIATEWHLWKSSYTKTDYEFQTFTRNGVTVQNQVVSATYYYKSKFVLGLVMEYSNDPFQVITKDRFWLGGNIRYHINTNNQLFLFAGQRRGGPACNAGVCYEVPDFEGMEIRLTTRL